MLLLPYASMQLVEQHAAPAGLPAGLPASLPAPLSAGHQPARAAAQRPEAAPGEPRSPSQLPAEHQAKLADAGGVYGRRPWHTARPLDQHKLVPGDGDVHPAAAGARVKGGLVGVLGHFGLSVLQGGGREGGQGGAGRRQARQGEMNAPFRKEGGKQAAKHRTGAASAEQ